MIVAFMLEGTNYFLSSVEGVLAPNTNQTESNPIVVWNNLTTIIGVEEKLSPPELAQTYALVHTAMYDLLLVNNNQSDRDTNTDLKIVSDAASTVLTSLFPGHIDQIRNTKDVYLTRIADPAGNYADASTNISEGADLGEVVGQQTVEFAARQTNNSNSVDSPFNNTIPTGPCIWNGSNPVLPNAGSWKTLILTSGSEVQPVEPFQCGSEEDLNELHDVIQARKNITPKQIESAHYWGDRVPPVIWNEILNKRIMESNMSVFSAARASAYLNVGMYDGFVTCWYTKYDYWTARPFQRIANFTTVIPTPNFPGYTSGHSVISVVASKVLGELFPGEKEYFEEQAAEAASSRFWSGIHFKQDIIEGVNQGMRIGNVVVDDMQNTPHRLLLVTAQIE
jgi:PAP2 superfamily